MLLALQATAKKTGRIQGFIILGPNLIVEAILYIYCLSYYQ